MDNFSEISFKKSTTFFNIENDLIEKFKNEMTISDESEPQKTVNQSIRAVPEPHKSDNLSDVTLV